MEKDYNKIKINSHWKDTCLFYCVIVKSIYCMVWSYITCTYVMCHRILAEGFTYYLITRSRLQLCQAPRLDKEKEGLKKDWIQTCWIKILRLFLWLLSQNASFLSPEGSNFINNAVQFNSELWGGWMEVEVVVVALDFIVSWSQNHCDLRLESLDLVILS